MPSPSTDVPDVSSFPSNSGPSVGISQPAPEKADLVSVHPVISDQTPSPANATTVVSIGSASEDGDSPSKKDVKDSSKSKSKLKAKDKDRLKPKEKTRSSRKRSTSSSKHSRAEVSDKDSTPLLLSLQNLPVFKHGTPIPSPVGSPGPRQLGRVESQFISPLSEFFWSDCGNPYPSASDPDDMIKMSASAVRVPDLIAAFSVTALENADHDILDLYESSRSNVLIDYLMQQNHVVEMLQCLSVNKPPISEPLGERAQNIANIVYYILSSFSNPSILEKIVTTDELIEALFEPFDAPRKYQPTPAPEWFRAISLATTKSPLAENLISFFQKRDTKPQSDASPQSVAQALTLRRKKLPSKNPPRGVRFLRSVLRGLRDHRVCDFLLGLLKPQESVVNWCEVFGISRLSLADAVAERLQEIFECHNPVDPFPYEVTLEVQHLSEVVRHCLRNIPFDSALAQLIRREEFCETLCAIGFWKSDVQHPLSETAVDLVNMLLETSYSSMKDGKVSVVSAPPPSAMIATLFSKHEDSSTSFFARLAGHFTHVPDHITFYDVRCARMVRLLLSPTASQDIVSQISASGVLERMLHWLPSHSSSCALAENICDAVLRFFRFAVNNPESYSLALLSIVAQFGPWSRLPHLPGDLHARSVLLIQQLELLSEGNGKMQKLLASVDGWPGTSTWARLSWSRADWPSSIDLPQAERERLRALGPQKMIAD
eukprot:TRINITY_DN477_c0_g1_i5.p1 TRINITY_DN477_c0_g1~~TRINITY_DN477_c0_g1_i5.p1  ORF type:complete len:715 (+),score=84.70 TRINITY_DN477_c0_g1_i5:441-2585(+)